MRINVDKWELLKNRSCYYKDWDAKAWAVMDAIGMPTSKNAFSPDEWSFRILNPTTKNHCTRTITITLTPQGKLEINAPYEKSIPYWYLKRAVEIVQEMYDAFEKEGLVICE